MPATTLQANPEPETLIMFVYPSIGADGPGRLIGRTLKALPLPFVNHAPLGASILGLVLLPITIGLFALGAVLGLGGYFVMKVFGHRYVLTNRSLQIWSSLGQRLVREVPLAQIAAISVEQRNGQAFYKAADLVVLDQAGNEVLTLEGVPRADVFRQTILKARDARVQVAEALKAIAARSTR
jgi:hypothetical protein